MELIFLDTNFIIEFFKGNKKVVDFMVKNDDKLCSNIIVYLETLFVIQKLKVKYKFLNLKNASEFFENIIMLPTDFIPLSEILECIERYGLKSNDAFISATCKYYGIRKIATFDEDFKRVEFLEIKV